MNPPRVIYVQYTDPAAYPPLQHSAVMFAEGGWRVDLVHSVYHNRIRFFQLLLEDVSGLRAEPTSGLIS